MILKVLGLIDVLMGFILLLSMRFTIASEILFWLGIILFFKAGYSILTAMSAGSLLDPMGYLDLLVSAILILLGMGISLPFNVGLIFGLLILIKGTWTMLA